jgi:hypothetical protein
MAHRLTVTGMTGVIHIDERAITKVTFDSDTPDDSNARATDYGLSMTVYGKMLFNLGASLKDQTIDLARWSQVPSHKADCYRKVEVEVVSASQVVRRFTLPDAFVMGYEEFLDDETGIGTFRLHVKQKKDENRLVTVDGGFVAEA